MQVKEKRDEEEKLGMEKGEEGSAKMERERESGQFVCHAAVILPRQLRKLLGLYLATKDSKDLMHTHALYTPAFTLSWQSSAFGVDP